VCSAEGKARGVLVAGGVEVGRPVPTGVSVTSSTPTAEPLARYSTNRMINAATSSNPSARLFGDMIQLDDAALPRPAAEI
jgi:hypothetical protein